MPVKPDPVLDLPPPWADAGNYTPGVYGLFLPWGAANPLAGTPLPWGNQPRLNSTGLPAFASNGLTPQVPNDASSFNEWLRRVSVWAPWVALGTSDPDADAHIVETNSLGKICAQAFSAEVGIIGAGQVAPVVLLLGFDVPASETSTFGDNCVIELGVDTAVTGTSTTVVTGGSFVFLAGGGPLAATAVGVSAGELFYGPTARVHSSPQGYVYGTGDQEAETALQASNVFATTTQSVVGRGAGDVRVILEGWGQRSTTGEVVIFVEQDQGTATWIDVGAGQTVDWLDTASANLWSPFRHERRINIGTSTATFFRARIDASGATTGKVRESSLRVVPERF